MEAGMLAAPQATEETSVGNVVPLPAKAKAETGMAHLFALWLSS